VLKIGSKISNDVLISSKTAARLSLGVGDEFHIFFVKNDPNKAPNSRKFTVSGIFNSGFEEFDEAFMMGDIRHIQRINKWDENQVGGFEIFVNDFDQLKQTGFEVYEQIDPSLNAYTIAEKFPAIFESSANQLLLNFPKAIPFQSERRHCTKISFEYSNCDCLEPLKFLSFGFFPELKQVKP